MNADEDAHIGTAENNKGFQHTGITTEMERLDLLDDCNCDYYKEYRDFWSASESVEGIHTLRWNRY